MRLSTTPPPRHWLPPPGPGGRSWSLESNWAPRSDLRQILGFSAPQPPSIGGSSPSRALFPGSHQVPQTWHLALPGPSLRTGWEGGQERRKAGPGSQGQAEVTQGAVKGQGGRDPRARAGGICPGGDRREQPCGTAASQVSPSAAEGCLEGSTGGGQLPLRLEWLTPAGLRTPNSGHQSQRGHCGEGDKAHGAPGRQGTAMACGCGRRCWGECPAPPRPPPLRRHCREPGSSRLPGMGRGAGSVQPLGQRRGWGWECESRHLPPPPPRNLPPPGIPCPRKQTVGCGLYPCPVAWIGAP